MLTPQEFIIARRILSEVEDPSLAITAIVLRRLIPKLSMEAINLAGHFIHAEADILDLQKDLKENADHS